MESVITELKPTSKQCWGGGGGGDRQALLVVVVCAVHILGRVHASLPPSLSTECFCRHGEIWTLTLFNTIDRLVDVVCVCVCVYDVCPVFTCVCVCVCVAGTEGELRSGKGGITLGVVCLFWGVH